MYLSRAKAQFHSLFRLAPAGILFFEQNELS